MSKESFSRAVGELAPEALVCQECGQTLSEHAAGRCLDRWVARIAGWRLTSDERGWPPEPCGCRPIPRFSTSPHAQLEVLSLVERADAGRLGLGDVLAAWWFVNYLARAFDAATDSDGDVWTSNERVFDIMNGRPEQYAKAYVYAMAVIACQG